MNEATDPFASIPAADPAAVEVRRPFKRAEKTVGLGSMASKQKRVDLNPMQRRWFEKHGYVYHRVEVANPYGGVTQDMWKIADYLACHPVRREILLVQTTTDHNANARIKKARKAPELLAWLAAGGRFEVHAWSQPGGPGARWEMRVREVTAVDLRRDV